MKVELSENLQIKSVTASFHILFLFVVVILLLFAEWCKEGLQEVQTFQGYHS